MPSKPTQPQLEFFESMFDEPVIAGVDEAGRGCLAGPVVAGAVILPPAYDLSGLTDSKKMHVAARLKLEPAIKTQATAWSIGVSWPREIDVINILQASLVAMNRAVDRLKQAPEVVLVDGNQCIPRLAIAQRSVISGDSLVPAISAASILAKCFRDRLMEHLSKRYPGYGFERNKGYGTAEHLKALAELGPCPLHRMSFKRVRPEPKEGSKWLPGI